MTNEQKDATHERIEAAFKAEGFSGYIWMATKDNESAMLGFDGGANYCVGAAETLKLIIQRDQCIRLEQVFPRAKYKKDKSAK